MDKKVFKKYMGNIYDIMYLYNLHNYDATTYLNLHYDVITYCNAKLVSNLKYSKQYNDIVVYFGGDSMDFNFSGHGTINYSFGRSSWEDVVDYDANAHNYGHQGEAIKEVFYE